MIERWSKQFYAKNIYYSLFIKEEIQQYRFYDIYMYISILSLIFAKFSQDFIIDVHLYSILKLNYMNL